LRSCPDLLLLVWLESRPFSIRRFIDLDFDMSDSHIHRTIAVLTGHLVGQWVACLSQLRGRGAPWKSCNARSLGDFLLPPPFWDRQQYSLSLERQPDNWLTHLCETKKSLESRHIKAKLTLENHHRSTSLGSPSNASYRESRQYLHTSDTSKKFSC